MWLGARYAIPHLNLQFYIHMGNRTLLRKANAGGTQKIRCTRTAYRVPENVQYNVSEEHRMCENW